jgi:hypothetical protein
MKRMGVAMGNLIREADGVIYLTATQDKQVVGDELIARMEKNGNRMSDSGKNLLRSKEFKPSAIGVYEVAVLKGLLFEDHIRTTENVHAKAREMKLEMPNADIACLIREQFSNKEICDMGLWWIVAMHRPINVSAQNSFLLSASRDGDCRWLGVWHGYPSNSWGCGSGFAFLLQNQPRVLLEVP